MVLAALWGLEPRRTSPGARTLIRRQESRQDRVPCPRAGAGEGRPYGQVVRFYQKWRVELTRLPEGLGL